MYWLWLLQNTLCGLWLQGPGRQDNRVVEGSGITADHWLLVTGYLSLIEPDGVIETETGARRKGSGFFPAPYAFSF
jgi:hypothetical protein